MADIPTTIEAIETTWLTEKLRAAGVLGSEVTVIGFTFEPVAEGVAFTSRLYRLHLQVDGPSDVATLVMKVPMKGAEGFAAPMYRSEVTFYRDFSGWMPIRAPRLYFGDMTTDASEFVLLLEDVVGHQPADQIEGFSLDQVRSAVSLLADFHAANWRAHDRLESYHSAFPRMRDSFIVSLLPSLVPISWKFYLSVARVQPADGTRKLIERFTEVLDPVLQELSRPLTLIHGDARGDNWFFDDRHEARVLDFQLVTQAAGMVDVAYLASQSLTVDTRRGADRELAEHYVSCLDVKEVEGYEFQSAWRQYRLATYLMIFMPLVAIGAWSRTNERGRNLCLELMERALAAIEDLDVGALLPT